MKLRSATREESKKIIGLATRVFKPNMGKQFIRLFSPDNHEHQMIAEDKGNIIAAVNYYPTYVDTSLGVLSVSSIGAVCTEEAYRGQGISSKLLHLAETKMKEEHVDFCIISGDGPLYQRFGAKDVGAMQRYIIRKPERDDTLDIRRFHGDPNTLYPLFREEAIKYQRTRDEFNDLFIAQTYPDNYQSYPVYTLLRDHQIISYIILVHHPKAKLLSIKEYAGDRKSIVQSFPFLIEHYKKEGIELTTSIHDPIQSFIKEKGERITQHATLKIIDIEGFLTKINRAFTSKNVPVNITKKEDIYLITIENMSYELDLNQLHSLIFSGLFKEDIPHIWLDQIFPIELPWSHNLNYQ